MTKYKRKFSKSSKIKYKRKFSKSSKIKRKRRFSKFLNRRVRYSSSITDPLDELVYFIFQIGEKMVLDQESPVIVSIPNYKYNRQKFNIDISRISFNQIKINIFYKKNNDSKIVIFGGWGDNKIKNDIYDSLIEIFKNLGIKNKNIYKV